MIGLSLLGIRFFIAILAFSASNVAFLLRQSLSKVV